jgi:drug/metabolite transporter (DMT)-like permease
VTSTWLVVLVYAAIALAWGATWPVAKFAVEQVPPLELSAIRFGLVGIVLVVAMRILGIPLGFRRIRWVVLAAAVGIFGYNALVFVALTMAPASDGALIVPTMVPVLTAVMATFIGEPLTRAKVAGFLVSSLGVAMVIVGGQPLGGQLSGERLLADLMALGGAICWSAYGVLGRIAMRDRSPTALVALTSLIGAAMLFPLGFLEQGYRDVPSWSLPAWTAVAFLVVFATILGFVLFYWAVRRFGAALGAMVGYLVPIAAVLVAFVFLGERPEPLQLIGGAVVLAGVRVATLTAGAGQVAEAAA